MKIFRTSNMAIDIVVVKNQLKNWGNMLYQWLVFVLELVLFYYPIVKTKFIEWTTFYIPCRSHLNAICLGDNEFVFITNSDKGNRARHLVNVFYKYYSPYDIRIFNELKETYLQVDSVKFNVYRFSTDNRLDNGKKYTVEFMSDNSVKINDTLIKLRLYSVDFKQILCDNSQPEEMKSKTN